MVRRVWRGPGRLRGHVPRRQLINLPLIYFEIEDVRPDENEGQDVDENEGQESSSSVLNSGGSNSSGGAGPRYSPVFDREGFVEVREGVESHISSRRALQGTAL